jgi:hypothetical protein
MKIFWHFLVGQMFWLHFPKFGRFSPNLLVTLERGFGGNKLICEIESLQK